MWAIKPQKLSGPCMKSESESEVTQSCPTLCDPMDCSLSGSSVHEILQARVLEWLAIFLSRRSSRPRNQTRVSHIAGRCLLSEPPCMKWSEVAQSCPTLCDPIDCSLPGSSVHGIFQAIVLEWIAISFSRGSSWARDQTQVSRIVDKRFTVWATREVKVKKIANKPALKDCNF